MTHQPVLHRHRRLLASILVAAWLGVFVLTHLPAGRLPEFGPVSDRWLHLCGYAVLASLFWLVLSAYGCQARSRVLVIAPVLVIYGAVDELTQAWVNRFPRWIDWTFNCLGVAMALTIWEVLALIFRRQAARPSR